MTFLNLIYPNRCPLCDELLSPKDTYVCGLCREKVNFLGEPRCCKCGRPIAAGDEEYCYACAKKTNYFEEGFAPFAYGGSFVRSMMRFKYGHRAEYADFYAAAIWHYGREKLPKWNIQAVLPVPVHRIRRIRRGYNQAEEIARRLAEKLQVPDYYKSIHRIKNTRPQKNLNDLQRRHNMRNTFRFDADLRLPENILIVDDIFTTGSTVNTLAALARHHGAKHVYFVTATIGSARESGRMKSV